MTTSIPVVDRYLAAFRQRLDRIPADERDELVREIESHIAEATGSGEAVAEVLERLGPPDRLARAYRAELLLSETRGRNWVARMFGVAGLLLTASIPSMILIPLLGGLGIGFLAGGIAALGLSVVPFYYSPVFDGLPEGVDRVLGAVTGLVLVALGSLSLALLWWYLRALAAAFRKVMQ